MWYITRRNKEVWWYTYDPFLPKVYLVLSLKKGKKETATVCRSLNRRCSSNETEKNVYPFICQFCKQYRKQDNNNNHFLETKLTTKYGEQIIEKAAEISEPKLYFEIKDVDLIAKEFSYNIEPCYMKFTKCVRAERERKEITMKNKGN